MQRKRAALLLPCRFVNIAPLTTIQIGSTIVDEVVNKAYSENKEYVKYLEETIAEWVAPLTSMT